MIQESARSSGELPTFAIFDGTHLVALAMTVVIGVLLCRWARRRTDAGEVAPVRRVARIMAVLQLVNQLGWHGRMIWVGTWTLQKSLPLHLCDGAVLITIIALWRPRPLSFEVCYFWSLAGALQALITPDITDGVHSYFFWQFFVTHSGLVIAGAWLAYGERWTPRRGSLLRMLVATNLWAGVAALANVLFDANYMFLSEKPPTGSLLDAFGPWPWYILVCEGLALVLAYLLLVPFRSRRAARPEPAAPAR